MLLVGRAVPQRRGGTRVPPENLIGLLDSHSPVSGLRLVFIRRGLGLAVSRPLSLLDERRRPRLLVESDWLYLQPKQCDWMRLHGVSPAEASAVGESSIRVLLPSLASLQRRSLHPRGGF